MNAISTSETLVAQFPRHWELSTADSNLTLHGFRRFKTTHLLNLRYLESEIAEVDHLIYQLGLNLEIEASATDRLGIKHCRKDGDVLSLDNAVTKDLIQRLRQLLREYDEALTAFNTIMSMETFSLLDDETQAGLRTELTLHEKHKTRLLRVDQGPRARQDPLQRSIHQLLRNFRYKRMVKASDAEVNGSEALRQNQSHQNSTLAADILGRVISAFMIAVFLLVPLAILSDEPSKGVQFAVISAFMVGFACIVSFTLRASNLEMMVVSAAYAAILSVFVSNNTTSK